MFASPEAGEDGKELVVEDGPLQAALELLGRELALFEVFLHELFVALGDHLDEVAAPLLDLGLEVGGDGRLLEFAALVLVEEIGLAGDDVHDSAEVLLLADRQLDGDRLAAEELLDGLDGAA